MKLDPVGLKRRSRGQIIEKIHVHFRGHSFDPKFMKLCQNVNLVSSLEGTVLIQSTWHFVIVLILIKSWSSSKLGYDQSKSRSLEMIKKSFLEGTVLIKSTWQFIRLLIIMKSRARSKLDYVA